MSKSFLRTTTFCCAIFFATSAIAIAQPTYHDNKNSHYCTNCSLLHHVNEEKDFGSGDARSAAEGIGYKVLTDPEKQKDHYVILGEKGGFYSELHVTKDRRIYVERMVDRNDPHWGAKIKR